jgi:hypothetical protein
VNEGFTRRSTLGFCDEQMSTKQGRVWTLRLRSKVTEQASTGRWSWTSGAATTSSASSAADEQGLLCFTNNWLQGLWLRVCWDLEF